MTFDTSRVTHNNWHHSLYVLCRTEIYYLSYKQQFALPPVNHTTTITKNSVQPNLLR